MDTTGFKVIKLEMDHEAIAEAREEVAQLWATDNTPRPNLDTPVQDEREGRDHLKRSLRSVVG